MTEEIKEARQASNAYNIFILVLTVLSLVVMVLLLLPLPEQTITLLTFYDNLICVIFLIDFVHNLRTATSKRAYFIGERGWLDLLGSIPSFGVSRYVGLLRLARLARFARVARLMQGKNKEALVEDVLENRSQYAAFITILLTLIVLTTSSVLVLQFESQASDASIKTGWEAFWYSVVTITTVGYGDYSPVTVGGRITAMFIMLMGVGVIGALASILSSILVGSPPEEEEVAPDTIPAQPVDVELAAIRSELAAIRQMLEGLPREEEKGPAAAAGPSMLRE